MKKINFIPDFKPTLWIKNDSDDQPLGENIQIYVNIKSTLRSLVRCNCCYSVGEINSTHDTLEVIQLYVKLVMQRLLITVCIYHHT